LPAGNSRGFEYLIQRLATEAATYPTETGLGGARGGGGVDIDMTAVAVANQICVLGCKIEIVVLGFHGRSLRFACIHLLVGRM
jgi:hypothetical protein